MGGGGCDRVSFDNFRIEDVREEGGVRVYVGDDLVEGCWGVRESAGCGYGLSGGAGVGGGEGQTREEGSLL